MYAKINADENDKEIDDNKSLNYGHICQEVKNAVTIHFYPSLYTNRKLFY